MKTNKTTLAIVAAIILAVLMFGLFSVGGSHITIDGEQISGLDGFTGFVLACVIAFVSVFFALSVTGLVLAGVALLLLVVLGLVLGSFALALLPLAIPFLALYGLIMLFSRKKTA